MSDKDIIESLKPICLCKGIRKGVFQKQMKNGINTLEGLRTATGAGNGSCNGKRCTPRIKDMLEKK